MATHSSVLAWRIPGTVEPGGLPSMGSHRVGHDWSDLAAAAHFLLLFWVFVTPWTAAHQASLSSTISPSLLKLMHALWIDDAIQPSHPLSSPSASDLSLYQCLSYWGLKKKKICKLPIECHSEWEQGALLTWIVLSGMTFCDPMGCSWQGFSIHGISEARILKWVAIFFSRGASGHKGWNQHLLCLLHWQADYH